MAHARIRSSYDLGPYGTILVVTADDDPAAGAEVLVTVPGRAVWEIHAFVTELTTDATSTTRTPQVTIDDGENTFAIVSPSQGQGASTIRTYSYYPGAERQNQSVAVLSVPWPPHLIMLPGWRLQTATNNLQAGDNFGAPILYVKEIPQRGVEVGQEALRSALLNLLGEESRFG